MDGKMCMSQRKIMKAVIALEENHAFHHQNIAIKIKGCYE